MRQSLIIIFFFLFLIWASYFVSFFIPIKQYGIVPRTLEGLVGIVLSPFLHGSLTHIIENSISFAVFSVILALLEGNKMFAKVLLMIVIGGSLTWLIGRNANHIGASGLIFSLWGYMLLAGWFSGQLKYIVVSLMLMMFYSGMIFGVFPVEDSVSWEGHLAGFIAGIIVSKIYHNNLRKNRITFE